MSTCAFFPLHIAVYKLFRQCSPLPWRPIFSISAPESWVLCTQLRIWSTHLLLSSSHASVHSGYSTRIWILQSQAAADPILAPPSLSNPNLCVSFPQKVPVTIFPKEKGVLLSMLLDKGETGRRHKKGGGKNRLNFTDTFFTGWGLIPLHPLSTGLKFKQIIYNFYIFNFLNWIHKEQGEFQFYWNLKFLCQS